MTVRAIACVAAASLLLAAPLVMAQQQLIHSERSLYRQVLVYEDQGTRCLCFTRECAIGRQSCLDLKQPNRLVFEYTHMMLGALYLQPQPSNILIIGLGGGTLPHALATLLPSAQIDVVEIDPAVVRVAQQYFNFNPSGSMQVIVEDGRVYVQRALRAGKTYDLVMLDAYDHQYIPEHMLTREFLSEVRKLLTPGGALAANTFSSSRLYQNESATYRAVFGDFFNLKSNNRVILWRNGALPSKAQLQAASERLAPAFKPFGFSSQELLQRFSTTIDWDPNARLLTDQYSPANLLNN
jgi:spermidine synthase